MRCPECQALNEADAAACTSCGLLLILPAKKAGVLTLIGQSNKRRRAEDLAIQRRRATDGDPGSRRAGDADTEQCQFCDGAVPPL